MLESLLNYVVALPTDRLPFVSLEDMSLCAAWFDSYRDNPAKRERYRPIRQLLDLWVHDSVALQVSTEGVRQQPLLRKLLDKLLAEGVARLTRDELDFLFFAWGLIHRTKELERFAKPISLLKPYMEAIGERRDDLEAAPGLPAISKRISIYAASDLRGAPVKDIKTFGGIKLAIEGPVLEHEGDVKIVEGIPAGCAVVIEEGSCSVNGAVAGSVTATNGCDILDDISGVVIARRGDVRARILLPGAMVLSKEGGVFCRAAKAPRLVYGSREIRIRATAEGGLFFGRRIDVAEEVLGGEFHVSAWGRAGAWRPTEELPANIVLRRALSCEDYGEVLCLEARRMLADATKLRRRITTISSMAELIEREADEYAGNALLFLLGEEETSERSQDIQRLHRRIAFIDRLMSGARSIVMAVENRLRASEQNAGGALPDVESESADVGASLLQDLKKELSQLAAGGAIDRDLFDDREEILNLGKRLQRRPLGRHQALQTAQSVLAVMEELAVKRDRLAQQAARKELELEQALGRGAILARAKEKCTRVEVLEQVVAAGRRRGASNAFRKRINDRYVKLMQRTIEDRITRVAAQRAKSVEFDTRLQRLRDRLWNEHRVSPPEDILDESVGTGAQVAGRFKAGVRICAWRYLLTFEGTVLRGLIVTPDTADESVVYLRSPRGLIECYADEEEEN